MATGLTFQSHNGAIAAMRLRHSRFRHIEVSIPQWCDCCQRNSDRKASEKLVSIPQWCDCCTRLLRSSPLPMRFNPTMVRLLLVRRAIIASLQLVSIPQWCDCCPFSVSHLGAAGAVSIPQWCDCCTCSALSWHSLSRVSIPQWCDCCNRKQKIKLTPYQVSIPQWCDCCFGL